MRSIIHAALALVVVTTAAAAAQPAEAERPRIVVTGEASIAVEPDIAQIRAGVTSDAKTARDAAQANAKSMIAVMAAIKAVGVAEKDIQTSRYSIQPVYESGPQSRNRLTGFQTTNSLLIKVRQLDKIDDLVDSLIAAGANTMSGIEFIVSDPSPPLDDARREAVDDARRKAELYAKAAGVTLGPAIRIVEQAASVPFQPMTLARSASAPQTPIAAGERTLRATVSVSYEIKK